MMEAGRPAGAMRLRGTPRGADCERPLGACPILPQPLLRASSTASCRHPHAQYWCSCKLRIRGSQDGNRTTVPFH